MGWLLKEMVDDANSNQNEWPAKRTNSRKILRRINLIQNRVYGENIINWSKE